MLFDGTGVGGRVFLFITSQARYEELSSKHSAAIVRSRLKYDHLAGRHVELQAEYEAVLEDLKKQAPPEVAGACSEVSLLANGKTPICCDKTPIFHYGAVVFGTGKRRYAVKPRYFTTAQCYLVLENAHMYAVKPRYFHGAVLDFICCSPVIWQ